MKKNIYILMILFVITLGINVNALTLKQYTKEAPEKLMSTSGVNTGDQIYNFPSPTYDFFDEDGLFNSIYTSKTKVYWTKYDKNMKEQETITIDKFYLPNFNDSNKYLEDITTTFGGAIYHKGHLFVVYGRAANGVKKENLDDTVLAVVKYDKTGKIVDKLEMETKYLADSYYYASEEAAYIPFFENGNCSLAINSDDALVIFTAKHRFDNHQSALLTVVNTETLEWVSNPDYGSYENRIKYYTMSTYINSHSLGQRVIATSDGGFITVDQGDASYRGINVNKYTFNATNTLQSKRKIMVHFREGLPGNFGGNNYIFSVLGNIIELDDGFMYVGAIENTLSQNYGDYNNESRNIFVQKYNKNMNDMTIEEAQMLEAEPRTVIDERESNPPAGKLYLTGKEVDYGMKFITDLKNKTTVFNIRSVEIEDNQIAILFEEKGLEEYRDGYSINNDSKCYYMIIDKDGNIIKEKEEIPNVELSIEENYAYKNGQIYWTTTDNNVATINVLTIKEIPITNISFENKNVFVSKDSTYKLKVTINPSNANVDTSLHFESLNSDIAIVDDNGEVTGIKNGNATIVVTTKDGHRDECVVTVGDYLKGDMDFNSKVEVLDAVEALYYYTESKKVTDKIISVGDFNNNKQIDVTDAVEILMLYVNE